MSAAIDAFRANSRNGNWDRIRRLVSRECGDLLSSSRVLKNLDLQSAIDRGVRDAPLANIVGSSGRTRDFDLHFHPLHDRLKARWMRVADATLQKLPLPPVRLVQVGHRYLVEDGHHRISVARALGASTIQAQVTELSPAGLQRNRSCTRLQYKV